jgi:hypothetical protein
LNTVESHVEDSYFKVKINDETKYIHKQSGCWLLIDEKTKLLNDRLLRAQQIGKKDE